MSSGTTDPETKHPCPQCGRPMLRTLVGDSCESCLFAAALGGLGERVGDYERREKIGEGATGIVYLAQHIADGQTYALKFAKMEAFETGEAFAAFRQELSIVAGLRHTNIVAVHRIDTHEGRPFLVLDLIAGGTLGDRENAARWREPKAALELMLKMTRAVQFAHQRGVLHCDLKPANILLDEHGEPHVSDFGLARTIGRPPRPGRSFEGGTVGWMSPEQVERAQLTTASDQFSLGVLLHWLCTGKMLFGAGEDFAKRVVSDERKPPGPWRPGLSWALSAIVFRAIQAVSDDRYASTAALVEDLRRARDNHPLRAFPTPIRGRIWLWSVRHPLVAAATGALLVLALFVVATGIFAARKQTEELRQLVLGMSAYAADGQAASVLYALREYADVIERAAADSRIRELAGTAAARVAKPSAAAANACVAHAQSGHTEPLPSYARGFDSLFVLDTQGCVRARWPRLLPELESRHTSFGWRDYFRGAERIGQRGEATSHVALGFRSAVSGEIRFALSTPILHEGEWIGVVAATITARSTLGRSPAGQHETDEQMTVLLGPFESEEQRTSAPASEFAILVHPSLRRGDKHLLDPKYAGRLSAAFEGSGFRAHPFLRNQAAPQTIDDYEDPLLGGQWLAAFAPVGGTGYVVLVQTRDAVALRPSDVLTRRLVLGLGGALCLALLLFGGFAWAARRQLRRSAPKESSTSA